MPRRHPRFRHLRTDPACSRFIGWGAYGLIPRWVERHLRGIACPVCWRNRARGVVEARRHMVPPPPPGAAW